MSRPVIRVERLTKRYGPALGIDDVSFEVKAGEVFGFLGPNGAGKTTTIRCLLDLLRPTSGRVEVFGLDPRRDAPAVAARVGYVPGELGLAESLRAGEHLRHHAYLRGGVGLDRIEPLARRFALDLDKPIRKLSRGNKQKVSLVQAFMHEPDLLVLDEPSSGLDPLMQREFTALVREARSAGATVFLSSHILSEVESLCDRVAVVRQGRLVALDDVDAIKAQALRHARARFARPPDAEALARIPGVTKVEVEGKEAQCVFRGDAGGLVRALASMEVVDLSLREPTLEEAFMERYA